MAPFLRFFVSPFLPPKPKSDNAEAIVMNFVNEQNRPLNALQKFNPKKTVMDTLQNEELNQMKKKNPDLQKQLEDICEFEAVEQTKLSQKGRTMAFSPNLESLKLIYTLVQT